MCYEVAVMTKCFQWEVPVFSHGYLGYALIDIAQLYCKITGL